MGIYAGALVLVALVLALLWQWAPWDAGMEEEVVPSLPGLRRGVIHGDGNDHNVIVGDPRAWPREAVSVVDFGDMHRGLVVAEPAVAAAYAVMGKADPLAAAARVVWPPSGRRESVSSANTPAELISRRFWPSFARNRSRSASPS